MLAVGLCFQLASAKFGALKSAGETSLKEAETSISKSATKTDNRYDTGANKQNFEQNLGFNLLSKSQYEQERKEYVRESNTLWLIKEDFKGFNTTSLEYCQKGVLEACMRLGENLMLGIGADRNFELAQKLFGYVIKNTDYEYIKDRIKQNAGFMAAIKENGITQGKEIEAAKKIYITSLQACLEKDYIGCLVFTHLSEILPYKIGTLAINGKDITPSDLSLTAFGILIDNADASTKLAEVSNFFKYVQDTYKQYAPNQAQTPQTSMPQASIPEEPRLNSQILAKRYDFTDGFSRDIS